MLPTAQVIQVSFYPYLTIQSQLSLRIFISICKVYLILISFSSRLIEWSIETNYAFEISYVYQQTSIVQRKNIVRQMNYWWDEIFNSNITSSLIKKQSYTSRLFFLMSSTSTWNSCEESHTSLKKTRWIIILLLLHSMNIFLHH